MKIDVDKQLKLFGFPNNLNKCDKSDVFYFLTKLDKNKSGFLKKEKSFAKYFNELYNDYIGSFNINSELPFEQNLWHFLQNDYNFELGKCLVCGNKCKFKRFSVGYYEHCSNTCAQLDENIIQKKKDTQIDKFGYEYASQSPEFKKRVLETNNAKYDGIGFASQELKNKAINTYFQKTGYVHNTKNPECLKNRKANLIDRYRRDHNEYILSDDDVWIKVNEDNGKLVSKSWNENKESILIKTKSSKINNYKQNHNVGDLSDDEIYEIVLSEMNQGRRKHILYKGVYFDSMWELMVYDFCDEHKFTFEYQPKISLPYFYDGKKHYYKPDFIIDGYIYEVKGDHFFEGDKMINPYDRCEYKDNLAEAKYQCMKKNKVRLIKYNDIKNLNLFFHKYNNK